MMYILYRAVVGRYFELSIISRMSSTPVLLAASISIISGCRDSLIDLQLLQMPHGDGVGPPFPSSPIQFKARAIILAVVVFPTPRIPVRIKAFAIRLVFMALVTVLTNTSCPIRSSKLSGRYFKASTLYSGVFASDKIFSFIAFVALKHSMEEKR